MEEPIDEEESMRMSKKKKSQKKQKQKHHQWRDWIKSQLPMIFHKRSDLKLLLSVVACPLSPFSVDIQQPLDVSSKAQYVIKQYKATTGCQKMENMKSLYVLGKVKMWRVEEEPQRGLTAPSLSSSPSSSFQKGCFVMWHMTPDKWHVDLVVGGLSVAAGCDGSVAWRRTPWLMPHAAKGRGSRPLRRALQGLDPLAVASMFSTAQYTGDRSIFDQDCFILKLSVRDATLSDRSDGMADIIKHDMTGWFSQKTGLLVHLEDSQWTRVQSPGSPPTYWVTTIGSRIEDYGSVDGVMIAHSGRSMVSLSRFGEELRVPQVEMRMEETWNIIDVAFDVPGLSSECFIPPEEVRKDCELGHLSNS
ncbi:hypothetical protein QJS04_geneDACA010143 [Acorus gramineus]|uniref:Uncharacterized protein n=1 Tax=Acorus gramineus TaxID=55184 RepID=A0AAV9A4C0_ACOGR|nr:hypothetical protein QJS04_geneDACA010143 [Acorus gramineus]